MYRESQITHLVLTLDILHKLDLHKIILISLKHFAEFSVRFPEFTDRLLSDQGSVN